MPVCSFCKESYEFPRGISVVLKDGSVKFFCGSKCRKNFNLGRDGRKVNWVRKSLISKEEQKKRNELRELAQKEREEKSKTRKMKEEVKKANKKENKQVKKLAKGKAKKA
jgi:large subunit ribosomal protein L24e